MGSLSSVLYTHFWNLWNNEYFSGISSFWHTRYPIFYKYLKSQQIECYEREKSLIRAIGEQNERNYIMNVEITMSKVFSFHFALFKSKNVYHLQLYLSCRGNKIRPITWILSFGHWCREISLSFLYSATRI